MIIMHWGESGQGSPFSSKILSYWCSLWGCRDPLLSLSLPVVLPKRMGSKFQKFNALHLLNHSYSPKKQDQKLPLFCSRTHSQPGTHRSQRQTECIMNVIVTLGPAPCL